MRDALAMGVSAAAALAMVGCVFGVVMARILWAEDLKHAQQIDEIRSKTEGHLRGQIAAMEKSIAMMEKTLAIFKGRERGD